MTQATPSRPLRVLVVDDHVPIRHGVRAALEGHGFKVVAEAGNGRAAVEAALRERPDICLMDIAMPVRDGITATREITTAQPETVVIMLSAFEDDENLFAALQAGASGYLIKGVSEHELRERLLRMVQGESPMSATLVARVIDEFRRREKPRLFHSRRQEKELTEREWHVLQLLSEDRTTVQIGAELNISPSAVRTNVGAILRKLQVRDRKAAVRVMKGALDRPR